MRAKDEPFAGGKLLKTLLSAEILKRRDTFQAFEQKGVITLRGSFALESRFCVGRDRGILIMVCGVAGNLKTTHSVL